MDVSDSLDWNQELIEEYVDEHPHNEQIYPSNTPTNILLIQVTINNEN